MRRPPRANARTVAEARRQGEIAKAESASVQQAKRPTIAPAFAQEVALLLKYAGAMSPEKRKAFLAALYEFDGDRAVEVSRE